MSDSLFSEVLLDHFRHPRNYGSLPSPEIAYEHFNPLCGDRIIIELAVTGSRVDAARFRGDACAICIAAASILTELVVGLDITRDEIVSREELLSALQSDIKPSRLKCALLPLEAVYAGIKLYNTGHVVPPRERRPPAGHEPRSVRVFSTRTFHDSHASRLVAGPEAGAPGRYYMPRSLCSRTIAGRSER